MTTEVLTAALKTAAARYVAMAINIAAITITAVYMDPDIRGGYVTVLSLASLMATGLGVGLHMRIHDVLAWEEGGVPGDTFIELVFLALAATVASFLFYYCFALDYSVTRAVEQMAIPLCMTASMLEAFSIQLHAFRRKMRALNWILVGTALSAFACFSSLAWLYGEITLVQAVIVFVSTKLWYATVIRLGALLHLQRLLHAMQYQIRAIISGGYKVPCILFGQNFLIGYGVIVLGVSTRSQADASVFQLALTIGSALQLFSQSLMQNMLALSKGKGRPDVAELMLSMVRKIIWPFIAVTFLLYIAAWFFVGLIDATYSMMRIYVAIILVVAPIYAMKTTVETIVYRVSDFDDLFKSVICASCIYALSAPLALKYFGVTGLCWSYVLSSTCFIFFITATLKKEKRFHAEEASV